MSDLPWVVPLGLVVLLGTWFTNDHVASHTGPVAATLCAVVAVAGLVVALRFPAAGPPLTSAAVTTFVLLDATEGPIYLTLAAAAFLAAARLDLRRWLPVVYGGAALVWAALLVAGRANGPLRLLAVAAVVTAGGAVGTLVRNRRREATERARAAAAEEQLRMAHDLHDGVGHGLAVIAMQAGIGLHVLDRDPAAVRAALEAIRDSARESLEALRAELSTLTGEPADHRPRHGLADLAALEARVRAAGLDVTVTGSAGPVPDPVGETAYVVVQEALTNVLKHAGPTSTSVALRRAGGRLCVEVVDDGAAHPNGSGRSRRGLEAPAAAPRDGLGLSGMRQRVEALGGSFSAGPRPTGGFEVRAELPL